MASIKISALGDMTLDRLSDTDVLIINDGDANSAVTQKVSFGTLLGGIDRANHTFPGRVEFSGEVLVTGNAAGTNVYTKTATDEAIAAAVSPVATDLAALTTRETALESLVGAEEQAGSVLSYYPIGRFTASSLSSATYTVDTAIERLGTTLDAEVSKILANQIAINTNSTAITNLDTRVTAAEADIDALETAVYGSNNGNLIEGNANNITTNVDNIGKLANTVGVAVGQDKISIGTITGGIIEPNGATAAYTVVGALGSLESSLVAAKAKADANEANIATSAGNITNTRDHSIATRNAVATACTQFKADYANDNTLTASDLADEILTALNGVVDPIYTAI